MFDNVETNSLGKRAALTDSNNITFTNVGESWGAMDRHILVFLGETSIFSEIL
jgi:hypothetical protein